MSGIGSKSPSPLQAKKEETGDLNLKEITFPQIVAKSSTVDDSTSGGEHTSNAYEPVWCDHYEFFKLCKINITEKDVNNLVDNGFDMEEIFFNVKTNNEEALKLIKSCLITTINLAQECRFRNMIPIIRDYMSKYTPGHIRKGTTMKEIMDWHDMMKNVDDIPSPRSLSDDKTKIN